MTIPMSWIISGLTAILGFLAWFTKMTIERSIDKQDRRQEREERQKEEKDRKRDEHQFLRDQMILRGLKVLTDCNYEVIYQMQTGHHNGGLDECMESIGQYKHDVDSWIMDLASSNSNGR